MADFLNRCTRSVLLLLAEEFETNVVEGDKNRIIIQKIREASDFDEGYAKDRLDIILEEEKERKQLELERKEQEKQLELERKKEEKQLELERKEQEKQLELERKEHEKNLELERKLIETRAYELEREDRARRHEIEKLKIQQAAETSSMNSTESFSDSHKSNRSILKELVPKFDPKLIDISLFFLIFERQAEKAAVSLNMYVYHLIPLLPTEIVELIVKEPAEKGDDYQHIKKLLLKRFKLGTSALKTRFESHQKKPGALWSDLMYELRSYLDNWLESVKVNDFESLKELMLTEQLKKRIPSDFKEKHIDEWDEFKTAKELVDKCDHYESVRSEFKTYDRKHWERKGWNDYSKFSGNAKFRSDVKSKTENGKKNKEEPKLNQGHNEASFDKKKPVTCFYCLKPGHIKPLCPEWLKKKNEMDVNHLKSEIKLNENFKPYLKTAKINGVERCYLRDTGASFDVIDKRWISNNDLTGEVIWLRQPLDDECKCLPLAVVEISGDFGKIVTKAAVKSVNIDSGYYLLGNKTAELIQDQTEKPELINAVMTRSRTKGEKIKETQVERNICLQAGSAELEESADDSPELLLESVEVGKSGLENVTADEFKKQQRVCASLKLLWDRAIEERDKEFRVIDGRLLRMSVSKSGDERVQICVPELYKEKILTLCHEEVSGHLGVTKTKDRILRCYFWPHCYKEIENFVRTCKVCQKVGHNRDKVKAPLKLVPIISEVFSKLNIDAVGPLPLSTKNNRYIITSICLASKYPDAIPVENISSVAVIDALLQIFSRTGYPKEVTSDLGTSFTSELTNEFFKRFGIKVRHSSVCHPQSNPVERVHSSLKKIMKALCLETGNDWERVLPMALFALRSVTHESTGFSPSELVHGKNLRLPHTLVYENWLEKENVNQNVVEYILNLMNRLKSCQDLAKTRMIECQDKRKLWYDKHAVSRSFKVGDQVLVLATSKSSKMDVNWMGPGIVTSVISETNYTIDLPEKKNKSTIYHVNLMKPYLHRPEFINLLIEPELESIEDEADIPYPLVDPTHFDFNEIVSSSELEKRVSPKQIEDFRRMLESHKTVFSTNPGRTHAVEMDIILTDETPIRAKPYRMSPRQTGILKTEIQRLLDLGVIEVGQSNFTSPMILVEVAGKDPRPCVDYRRLNAKTRTEFFPLPNIEEVVERVSSAHYITVMDLTKGYFQIPLTKRARRYAAFVTPFGTYLPRVMFFGMVNAPYNFCRLIAEVLSGLESFAVPYIDDIAVFSETWEQHLKDVNTVLKRLEDANLTVKPSKCKFAQNYVKFLGHEVGSGKRSPSEIKIEAIRDFPIPTTKTQLRAYLGTVGYYARYIKNYATIAVPLTNALKGKIKREKIEWNDACNTAFEELKAKLMKGPVLYAPDFSQEFIVQTDASLYGAGVVLSQVIKGEEHPIIFLSKKFSKAEQNYSTIERELAAIIYGLKKLNHYLDGQRFIIQTDHNPLTYIKNMVGSNSRITRWALCLQQFNFKIEHKSGRNNGNADGLSRAA